ncbi:MAG: TlpA family protein disulfide reductase [Gammaproteobacteria bacterium]|nr:TlpA family protein disulfide reductase [Gammaproteobacteria bacterium]
MHPSTQNPAHGLRLPLWLLALALGFCFGQVSASHEANEPSDGTVNSFRWLQNPLVLPETSLQRWQVEAVSLSSFKGKIVLLNLWATWCPPCVYELPALDRLQQRLGNEEFVVVTVSVDHDPGLAHNLFTGKLALANLEFYFENPERLGKTFPLDVLPSNFIIDREGRATGMLRSYVDWDSPAADEFVKRLLAGTLPARPQN